jgi:hypothetical protein
MCDSGDITYSLAKGKIIKKDKKNDPQNTTQKTKN